MPAGSGPSVSAPVTSGSITTGTNAFTLTGPTFATNGAAGTLITVNITWTPSATQTVTVKLYQGSTSGVQVGPVAGLTVTATGTTQTSAAIEFVDTSAYATGPTTGGVYVAGFTGNTGTGTVAYGFIELETIAPVQ